MAEKAEIHLEFPPAGYVMMTSSNGNIFHVTGQWRGALMSSLICVWINVWVNNSEAGDLRHYRAHYDVTVMSDGESVVPQSELCDLYSYKVHMWTLWPIFIQNPYGFPWYCLSNLWWRSLWRLQMSWCQIGSRPGIVNNRYWSWRHQIETFSAILALCVGNSPVTGEFPSQRPMTWSFDIFFDLHLNKWLSKQSKRMWFEMSSCSLWHHCNDQYIMVALQSEDFYGSFQACVCSAILIDCLAVHATEPHGA